MTGNALSNDVDLREAAIARWREKRDFLLHTTAYLLVNLVLNSLWLLTTPGGFYWPIFPLLGWGIGLVFHAIDTYAPEAPSEERIRREMDRLAHR